MFSKVIIKQIGLTGSMCVLEPGCTPQRRQALRAQSMCDGKLTLLSGNPSEVSMLNIYTIYCTLQVNVTSSKVQIPSVEG